MMKKKISTRIELSPYCLAIGEKLMVVLKRKESGCREVTTGVPQGSVLVPVLLHIFINDLLIKSKTVLTTFDDEIKLGGIASMVEDPDII